MTEILEPSSKKSGGTEPTSMPHACPYALGGADEKRCDELTGHYQRNFGGCCQTQCNCVRRRCHRCLAEGRRTNTGFSNNPTTGLCEEHGVKLETPTVRPQARSVTFADRSKTRDPHRVIPGAVERIESGLKSIQIAGSKPNPAPLFSRPRNPLPASTGEVRNFPVQQRVSLAATTQPGPSKTHPVAPAKPSKPPVVRYNGLELSSLTSAEIQALVRLAQDELARRKNQT